MDLLSVPSTDEFRRLARATLLAAGIPIAGVGAHSFQRGRAAELLHGGTSEDLVSQVLRHRNPASTRQYVFTAARLTALASAIPAPPDGRPQGPVAAGAPHA
jgi:integrase